MVLCLLSSSVVFADNGSSEGAADPNAETIKVIDEYVLENLKKMKVPGLSFGIVIEGLPYYLNYGVSDVSSG